MIVTCYYDIYNNSLNADKYFDLFRTLGTSGLSIILFTSADYEEKCRDFPAPCVTVIYTPLETFELYNLCMSYKGELPNNRNTSKDTREYLSLMNTKIGFIQKAAEYSDDDTFIWIDFGILKIIKDTDAFIHKLRFLEEKHFLEKSVSKKYFLEENAINTENNIVIPGCWGFNTPHDINSINWRFCGGVIFMPRVHIQTFYDYSKQVITELCTQHKLTWEVNVWNIIESRYLKSIITWYSADHNDTILSFF
jgi:hypothetical protein